MFEKLMNRFGWFGLHQQSDALKERDRWHEYANYLEAAVNGMTDPSKPIVVLGDDCLLRDIRLLSGQQIIISPSAKRVQVIGVITLSAGKG